MSGSKTVRSWLIVAVVLVAVACKKDASPVGGAGQAPAAAPPGVPAAAPAAAPADMASVQPAELAKQLGEPGDKPLLLHVGFRKLYLQAHIPGSEYLGPTSDDETLAKLKQRVADLPKTSAIVLYCGCCPWEHCPNVKPAYQALHDLGFSNAKVLYVAKDFGADWVDKGYPVATGE
jgi:rhodanese-related sulfurtransferase